MVAVAALAYAGDWAVLRVRVARGAGFGSVEVSRFMVTPLKSGKAEYDFLDRAEVQCTRSAFPQMGDDPCWWVEQHRSEWILN